MMFEAIEKRCKTEAGYASLANVEGVIGLKDEQPSWLLAETYVFSSSSLYPSFELRN